MLYATGKHTRRLLLPGDEIHRGRNGKIFPEVDAVPEEYLPLLEWAKERYESAEKTNYHPLSAAYVGPRQNEEPKSPGRWLESLFELEGLGKEHWKDVDPDEYVRQLREGWE
jgi:hypothetical protein